MIIIIALLTILASVNIFQLISKGNRPIKINAELPLSPLEVEDMRKSMFTTYFSAQVVDHLPLGVASASNNLDSGTALHT
jgi:hypothetical protein